MRGEITIASAAFRDIARALAGTSKTSEE